MSVVDSKSSQAVLPRLPELRSATVFGRNIRYYDLGSGPALVLIHGIGGDADDWAFCLQALSASHRVIALDLLGFGRSDKPLIDYSIAGFVDVLERFLPTLRIERTALVGGSLGGWSAASWNSSRTEQSCSRRLTPAECVQTAASCIVLCRPR